MLNYLLILIEDIRFGFQDSASGFGEALVHLYNVVGVFLVVIFIIVFYMYVLLIVKSSYNRDFFNYSKDTNKVFNNFFGLSYLTDLFNNKGRFLYSDIYDITEFHLLETIWTIIPGLSLMGMFLPSLSVEYWADPDVNSFMVVKVIGRQWYWSYECHYPLNNKSMFLFNSYLDIAGYRGNNNYEINSFSNLLSWYSSHEIFKLNFDMNIIDVDSFDVFEESKRLLSVDNRLVLPVGVPVKVLITSADVLHSWALPSLGIKVDAVPGRLSSIILVLDRPGFFFGQCSELCGVMHGFMPIVIEGVDYNLFSENLYNENFGTSSDLVYFTDLKGKHTNVSSKASLSIKDFYLKVVNKRK